VANIVPGIDFTDDPLMQARLFSYLDTQLSRLGGPNFTEIPINRPLAPVHNHQQDGHKRHTIDVGKVNYFPNTLGGGCPHLAAGGKGGVGAGFVHHPEQLNAQKIRARSESFGDHYSQAGLFFRSMTPPEKEHLIDACRFELGRVHTVEIRQRMLEHFARIDGELSTAVAIGLGMKPPKASPVKSKLGIDSSPALSVEVTKKGSIRTRRIAVLVADGVDSGEVKDVTKALMAAGALVKVVAKHLGKVKGKGLGGAVEVDKASITTASIEYDAVYIPGGKASVAVLKEDGEARHFVLEAYRHFKTIGATSEGVDLLREYGLDPEAPGVVTDKSRGSFEKAFIAAIGQHRHWDRADQKKIPG
jgi:catalase